MATTLQRAYQNLRVGEAVVRDANRLRQILTTLIRHGFGAVVQQLNLDERWLVRMALERRAAASERLPIERRILLAVHDLGPTFIKLGQILSTRADLLPPALIGELKTLQDAVPPLPAETVRGIIRDELGRDVDELFDGFEAEPLACASIAQVHRARLKGDGTAVVLKVQRPNLQRQIEADLEIMGFLARALEANFPEARLYSPAGIVAEFEKAIAREIDFTHELEHIERFRGNFRDRPGVHFPTPYKELCTARVLTMEYIAGTKITAIAPPRFDVDAVVRTALEVVQQMIFGDGFFHGDLHPGNLLVRDDNVLCLIDFGLCGRLSARQRDTLVDLVIGMVREDFPAVARLFWRIGAHGADSTRAYDIFEADVVECLEREFAGKTMEEIEFSRFFRDLVALALKHRIQMPPDYTMTFKALMTMEGVAKELQPNLDLMSAVRPYVMTLLAERYSPRRLLQQGYDALRELSDSVQGLPALSRAVFDDLHAGRTKVNVEVRQLRELQRTYAAAQKRRALALLAGAGAVCGTLALEFDDRTVLGFPAVSFWFYLLAALFAAWFLLSTARGR